VQPDRFIAVFRYPAERRVHASRMVREVSLVKRPEILFVGEQIDHFVQSGVGSDRLEGGDDILQWRVVDDEVDSRKRDPAVEVVPPVIFEDVCRTSRWRRGGNSR